LNFCEKIISGVVDEEVNAYHTGFAKLYRWLKMAIEARKADITRRKALAKRAKEDRKQKQEQAEERKNNRDLYLNDAREKFNEDHKDEIDAYNQY
jgi:hypothetical protein